MLTQIWRHDFSAGDKPDFEGPLKLAELNFSSRDDSFDLCLESELHFLKTDMVILLYRTFTGAMEVVILKFPMILYVGTLVGPSTQIYLCQGYATLSIKEEVMIKVLKLLIFIKENIEEVANIIKAQALYQDFDFIVRFSDTKVK
ncbi:hypothetical protein K501DRAFT_274281 [Backusella circina FSU 941]|nr:hypothetical protein K501DRAFT_274281 [Backusella circina FSU 941]